jgi:hypothetical protein
MRIALRSTVPLGATIRIADSRAMPLDWERWRDALLGGPPMVPPAEEFTAPEGWPVTIAEVAVGELVHVHAFYAILDRAVHAWSAVRSGDEPARAELRSALCNAAPIWQDDIVALADLEDS